MGYGAYSHKAHEALTAARGGLASEKLFVQRECHPRMSPFGVKKRESRDSEAHPRSLGIVFALDVTGSMGAIPTTLAQRELPRLMKVLGEVSVPDPQLLFMAIGDAVSDSAPLQVGQFESEAGLMDQWLTSVYLEGRGGDIPESYELAYYFLANHTEMDCAVKRNERGYLFMTGDAPCFPAVKKDQVLKIIGSEIPNDVPTPEIVRKVSETFHPFFVVPDVQRGSIAAEWRALVGDYVIVLEDPSDAAFVAAALVALTQRVVAFADLGGVLGRAGASAEKVPGMLRSIRPYADALANGGPRLGPKAR
jgi:hypothetical protein